MPELPLRSSYWQKRSPTLMKGCGRRQGRFAIDCSGPLFWRAPDREDAIRSSASSFRLGGYASASWLRGLQSTKPCCLNAPASGSSSIQANPGHKPDFIEFVRSEASQVVFADLAGAEQPGEDARQDGVAVVESAIDLAAALPEPAFQFPQV